MEYFLILICFNALVLGLLVLIFKPFSVFNLKTTALLGLASLGLGFSLPLSLLYFNHVTVILIYGLVVVIFASRLSSSLSKLPDQKSVEASLATPTLVYESADTNVGTLTEETTAEVTRVLAEERTTTPELVSEVPKLVPVLVKEEVPALVKEATELVPELVNEVPAQVSEDPELVPVLVNEVLDEGDKGADEVIVPTAEVIASPDVVDEVVETPFAEPVIISPLEEDVPDATSLALPDDEVPVLVDDILTVETAGQILDAEPEPLDVIIDDFVEATCEDTVPADTETLMDDLTHADQSKYDELPETFDELLALLDELPELYDELPELYNELPALYDELPALNESASVLIDALPQAIESTKDDVPCEELIPDVQEQDIYSIIKAGFDARSMGDTTIALGLFIRGLDYSNDPQLSLLMAKEISDIYKESGQYFLAATILRSLADSGSGLSMSEQQVLLEHAVYLEQMENN